ncbi:MAG: large subunit ribosomal protein L33 [Elusimicrobia bacterium]|jgi:large subunit ribosomal protein L33|nr:MAG: large subunit ribosomal protein L33 [Elusimicrobiota bacterium]
MPDRHITTLACTLCKNKNYHFSHTKKKQYKLEIPKFCKACKKQTPHKESK